MGKPSTSTEEHPPEWIEPQLTRLVDDAPDGPGWLHEIKYDGYPIHTRIDGNDVRLLTRTGLDWSHRYQATTAALGALKVRNAYIDGELCAVTLVFFAFDLLFLDG
jgi:ATP-dependent DNA ligase